MSEGTKKIFDALGALIDKQGSFRDHFLATPFVKSEKEFGIVTSPQNGGLYAVHHIIDSLEQGQFFEGQRKPNTDLDSMAYNFEQNSEIAVYEGVIASRNSDEMTLNIKTNKSVEETLAAISVGIATAQTIYDTKLKEQLDYANNVRAEFAKESAPPLFGTEEKDVDFVRQYLKAKTEAHLGENAVNSVDGPLQADPRLTKIFAEFNVEDTRPRLEIKLRSQVTDYSVINDFYNQALGSVFPAPLAVYAHTFDNDRVTIEVKGNPSRLARDISEHDPELASTVAHDMRLSM